MPEDTTVEVPGHRAAPHADPERVRQHRRAASGHEERSVAALEDFFAGASLSCERYTSEPGRMSLIAPDRGPRSQAPTLLLMGHTDVVPVSPSGWQRDPFGGELVDGIVWGRGAIDMLNLTSRWPCATRGSPERLAAARHADLPGRRRRGGRRLARRRPPGGADPGRGSRVRLRRHRERRRADPDARRGRRCGVTRRREGRQLAASDRARHARPRLATIPHRQRPRDRAPRSSGASPSTGRSARILDAWRGLREGARARPSSRRRSPIPSACTTPWATLDNLALAREGARLHPHDVLPNIAHGGGR